MAGRAMSNWSQRPDTVERDFEFKDSDADHALAQRIDEVTGG
jgi:hypothetical protein